jgi:Coenzyme PQQ synthesis protein D (PqqD)
VTPVPDDSVLVRCLDVTARRTDSVLELVDDAEGGVLLETLIGRYVLNRDAREVWRLVDGRRSVADIAERLGDRGPDAGPRVRELCERLRELGLLEDVAPRSDRAS